MKNMNIQFKNAYDVCVMNPGDCDIEFRLSDYDTFEEFTKELKSHRIKWNKYEGCFTYRGEEEGLFFVISEKDYGAIADWCHPELVTYMQEKLYKDWFEDGDSVFFAPGLELEDAFNQLKKIDGVELELICEIEPGDYINKYVGPYQYGEAWEQIKVVSEAKATYKVDSATDTSKDFPHIETIEFIDWDAIDKMLQGQK